MALVVFTIVAGVAIVMCGRLQGLLADPQSSMHVPILRIGPQQEPAGLPGLPEDWTHHHLVFSDPGTEEDAVGNGTHDAWASIVNDPRYVMQQLKRHLPARGPWADYVDRMNQAARDEVAAAARDDMGDSPLGDFFAQVHGHRAGRRTPLHSDWSMDPGTGNIGAGQYPAKFTYSTTATGICSNSSPADYVAYNTGTAGVAATAATGTLTFAGTPSSSATKTAAYAITLDSVAYYYTVASGSVGSPASGQCLVSTGGSEANAKLNLAGAISNGAVGNAAGSSTWLCYSGETPNSAVTSVANNASTITMNSSITGTVGNLTLTVGGSVSNVTAGTTAGANGQANIIAYDNIYSGCSTYGNVPMIYWSYYTGTGTASTSSVTSFNGDKVAFIESGNPSSSSTLRIVRWKPGEGYDFTSPVAPDKLYTNTNAGNGANTAWSTCPATGSCMISVAFYANGHTDTSSAPWYDYASDTLWVGDSGGYLHEFTGVFQGTPGEVSTNWPVAVASGSALTSPVYDNTSGHQKVFLGSSNADQYLYSVTTTGTPAVATSGQLGESTTVMNDAPLVDPSADSGTGTVYAWSNYRTDTSHNAAVWLFFENAISGQTPSTHANFTAGSTSIPLYAGTFDNEYYTSASAGTPTGNMWVCAGPTAVLYAVAISGNSIASSSVTTGPTVGNGTHACSPVTEFCTTSTGAACAAGTDTTGSTQKDYIFASPTDLTAALSGTNCTAGNGCVLSYTITIAPAATYVGSGPFPGGASGMIIDTQNTTVSGTLQLYFGILGSESCGTSGKPGFGTGGCAIQAPQTGP